MSLVALVAAVALQAGADPFAGLTNTRVVHYPVSGRSAAAVRRSMEASRPAEEDGRRYDGLTTWEYGYRYRHDGRGGCDPATTEVTYTITVTMPQLTTPGQLDRRERASWDAYYAGLAAHERNHVLIALRGAQELERAIRAAEGCAGMEAAAQRVMADVDAASRTYDERTRHGGLEIPPFG
jgi:predicted secreted Zn-dependent protease